MKRTLPALLALPIAAAVAVGAPTASFAKTPSPTPVAHEWLTTPDRAQQLAPQPDLPFTTVPSNATTIVVDPETAYQRLDGVGASITDSSASLIAALPAAKRDALMRSVFSVRDGVGFGFLRQPIGSSDFTAQSQHYTFDDVPAGRTDFGFRHFSIAHDLKQVIPLIKQAKRLNPRLQVMLTPWSPPAWMKSGDSLVGGTLKPGARYEAAYATYLALVVRAYERAGVQVDYLSVQNEPQNRAPKAYPGTDLPAFTEAAVIDRLGPLLRGTGVQILGYDHNWRTDPNDVATTPAGRDPETDYPYELLRSSAARWIAGTAYHCYSGDPSAMTALQQAFPKKGIWFTECSGSHGAGDSPAKYFNDTLRFDARTLGVGVMRNQARSVVTWNLALRADGGPHLGGCDTCTGVLQFEADGSITKNAEYFALGHLSKFVRQGAVRIASTSFGTPAYNGQVTDVAFRNPDGSRALYVHNENDQPRQIAVEEGGRRFTTTLPGGSVATFTWAASRALVDDLRPVAITGATATATASADGDVPGQAVDGDASTRWSSGTAQVPGLALTVDLGKERTFRRVDLDSGGNLGDFLRAGVLEASRDGRTWSTLSTIDGTGQLAELRVHRTTARYLRFTSTGSAGNWWSVSDVRLYR